MRAANALAAAVVALSWGAVQRGAAGNVDSFHEKVKPEQAPTFRHAPLFLVGVDFGLGAYDGFCSICHSVGGVALGGYGGVLALDQVAFVVAAQSLIHPLPAGAGIDVEGAALVGMQVWTTPVLWLRAGIGAGMFVHESTGGNLSSIGPAAALSVGAELLHRPRRGVDLAGRVGLSDFDLGGQRITFFSVVATVGFHWL